MIHSEEEEKKTRKRGRRRGGEREKHKCPWVARTKLKRFQLEQQNVHFSQSFMDPHLLPKRKKETGGKYRFLMSSGNRGSHLTNTHMHGCLGTALTFTSAVIRVNNV